MFEYAFLSLSYWFTMFGSSELVDVGDLPRPTIVLGPSYVSNWITPDPIQSQDASRCLAAMQMATTFGIFSALPGIIMVTCMRWHLG